MTERVITDKTEVPLDELRNLFLDLLDRLDLELVEETAPDLRCGVFSLRPKTERKP